MSPSEMQIKPQTTRDEEELLFTFASCALASGFIVQVDVMVGMEVMLRVRNKESGFMEDDHFKKYLFIYFISS